MGKGRALIGAMLIYDLHLVYSILILYLSVL